MMNIADYIDPQLVAFLEVESQTEAIDALIDLLHKEGKLPDKEAFRKAIYHRESLVSTGIGMGVAIPHAKMSRLSEFFIAIGLQQQDKGLEWNALDKAPVRIVFLIGGPDNRQAEYLQILSHLTVSIKETESRKKLLKAKTKEEVVEFFVG
ncbi:MAG: system protein [Chlamydiota bacterium]|jgi:PTS system nitrogen regulatory IIA component